MAAVVNYFPGGDALYTLAADGATLTIPVSGESDGDYEMWGQAVMQQNGATNTLSVRPNGLATNQTGHFLLAAAGVASGGAFTTWDFANGQQVGADTTIRFHAYLTSKTGRARLFAVTARYNPTGASERFVSAQCEWTDTTAPMTSIVLNSTQGLRGTTTFVRLRKLRNLT